MHILYDDNMPYADHYFSDFDNAKAFTAGHLFEQDLAKCTALFVRSTTTVDASLLQKAPNLRYVATATAGFDHLSLNALKEAKIESYVAAGCNARAVAEYVLASLYTLAERHSFRLQDKTVGIVGVGKVGAALAQLLSALDIVTINYDPPRAQRDEAFTSAEFEEVLSADIISLHVPLVRSGAYPSYHMINNEVLARLHSKQIIINACRGEVLDNQALLSAMKNRHQQMPLVCLDCWENEPNIDRALIPYLSLATAHIAGHSLEGKANGTDMVYQDFCRFLSIKPTRRLDDFLPAYLLDETIFNKINHQNHAASIQTIVSECIKCMYDIENDDSFFRLYMAKSMSFSEIRRSYPVRREWPATSIKITNDKAAHTLKNLGFKLASDSE